MSPDHKLRVCCVAQGTIQTTRLQKQQNNAAIVKTPEKHLGTPWTNKYLIINIVIHIGYYNNLGDILFCTPIFTPVQRL